MLSTPRLCVCFLEPRRALGTAGMGAKRTWAKSSVKVPLMALADVRLLRIAREGSSKGDQRERAASSVGKGARGRVKALTEASFNFSSQLLRSVLELLCRLDE
jgi:hypothetical protein